MFVQAIETVASFTRPILSISRNYGSTTVLPGAATLFFINDKGWALTCKHVAENVIVADQIHSRYNAFRTELSSDLGPKQKSIRKQLEQKYGYYKGATVELRNNFVDCIVGNPNLQIILHPTLDIALIRFESFDQLLCTKFPVFAEKDDELKQGKSICRLGFPFPEFENFEYDSVSESIKWTSSGKAVTPRFPIEGMVTRHLANENSEIVGFELSTPGLRGQSGGPAFDAEGRIWGIQAATSHLDLDFDVDQEVYRNGIKKRVQDSAFLHVGKCIHVKAIKEFMITHNVQFSIG